MNKETRKCQNCKTEFIIEPEDFQFYEKMQVPPPTWCPECRLIRRLIWRNERTLYKRKCDAPGHGEEIISYLAPEKPFPVYDQKYWWSDAWDAIDYGQNYDWDKPFFAQFKELLNRVPHASMSTNYSTMVNSEYSNWSGSCKNCYLVTDADFVEDSAYCSSVYRSKDCYDCYMGEGNELCYDNFNINKCYRAVGSVNCHESNDIFFSKGLVGCSHCFGCINLRKKSYHIFNQPYSKEKYSEKLKELFDGSWKLFVGERKKAEEFWLRYPHKHLRGIHNVNSLGDYIYHTKNTAYGFFAKYTEDSKFVALIHSPAAKDCFDYTDWGDNAERLYECMGVGLGASNIKFSNLVFGDIKNSEYSYFSNGSSDLFGCAGLHKKQYCILNKQYTKEEYSAMIPKIKKHMDEMPYIDAKGRIYKYGEFMPPDLSAFAYNEAAAHEFYPLTKEFAREKGFAWRDEILREYKITKKTGDLPENIKDVPDTITNEIIECEHKGKCNQSCTTAFRIIAPEFQFLKKMGIPLPRLCPNCRHYEKFKYRNPLKFWHRACACEGKTSDKQQATGYKYENTAKHSHGEGNCPNEFETTYSPDSKEIVYCEECYQKETT